MRDACPEAHRKPSSVLDVNAVGCWLGMKAVIGPMREAGGGSIVNISSVEGFTGAAGLSAYSASKFAIRGMGHRNLPLSCTVTDALDHLGTYSAHEISGGLDVFLLVGGGPARQELEPVV
jgi:hypothetical protein